MHYGINSTNQQGNAYILIGVVVGIVFSGILFFFGFQPETSSEDLITIKDELIEVESVQIVKKQIGRDNKSTVLTLKNHPGKKFNIGETISLSEFEGLISGQSKPINIELLTTKRFYNYDRPITPAFHGLKINNKEVLTVDDGLERDSSNKLIAKIGGFFSLTFGLAIFLYGRRMKRT